MKLNINENIVPVVEPQRRIPFHIREKVKIAIEKLLADDTIEKVPDTQATPWIRPIAAVPKGDDSVRMLICAKPTKQIKESDISFLQLMT